jgi:hypothetical protein
MRSHHKKTTENKRVTQENKCFLVSKSDLQEMRNTTAPFIVLLYKEPLIYSSELPSTLHSIIQISLQEFKDVFPNEVPPGLPLICGIEHQIDFVPGAILQNRPAYHTNPKEIKKIERQAKELTDKGYVHESLSPCVVPVLLVPKKDGSWCMCFDCRAIIAPDFKAKIGYSSYVCPGSRFHTYSQNYSNSDKTSVIIQSTLITII